MEDALIEGDTLVVADEPVLSDRADLRRRVEEVLIEYLGTIAQEPASLAVAQSCQYLEAGPGYDAARGILAKNAEVRIGGFLDDNPSGTITDDAPCLGGIEDYHPRSDDVLVVAIGRPSTRRTVTECLAGRGPVHQSHPSKLSYRGNGPD